MENTREKLNSMFQKHKVLPVPTAFEYRCDDLIVDIDYFDTIVTGRLRSYFSSKEPHFSEEDLEGDFAMSKELDEKINKLEKSLGAILDHKKRLDQMLKSLSEITHQ